MTSSCHACCSNAWQPSQTRSVQTPIRPPRKISKNQRFFAFFRPTQKIGPDGPKWGQEDFFPTNPDLADILGRTDFDFENFYFLDFLDLKFPDFWVPDFQISSLGPGLGPDAAAGAAGRILRSQPDPSPNAPRDQIRRKDPCCDSWQRTSTYFDMFKHVVLLNFKNLARLGFRGRANRAWQTYLNAVCHVLLCLLG